MPIGKQKTEAEKMFAGLPGPQDRIYSGKELADFHQKIQQFRFDKTLTTGEKIRPLDWYKMAVAFGAMSVIEYQKRPYYRICRGVENEGARFLVLCNLWSQYQDWMQKGDWIEQKKLEAYEKMDNGASLDELSTVVSGQ